jgi:hypothetical protein
MRVLLSRFRVGRLTDVKANYGLIGIVSAPNPLFRADADPVADTKQYSLQLFYKTEREERYAGVPGLAPGQ